MPFTRDRLTWVAYLLLGWFAYLQAAPGLVVPHLRAEMVMTYAVAGLHVSAFAAGSIVSALVVRSVEQRWGRRWLIWGAALAMGLGGLGLIAGRQPALTIASVLVMGVGGGLLLTTIQAMLTDHHGEHRTIALTEANVGASISYVLLIGVFTLLAALSLNWRFAVLASLAVPLVLFLRNRSLPMPTPAAPVGKAAGKLPRGFWVAVAMIFSTVAAEWCLTGWGASFVEAAVGVSPERAVTLMAAYFGGVLVGRIAGSVLARRQSEVRLLAVALAITAGGFAVLYFAVAIPIVVLGLFLAGCGIGNLFPLGFAIAMGFAPGRATVASARVVMVTSGAVLLAPLTVGALADATSISTAMLVVVPTALLVATGCLLGVRRLQAAAIPG